MYLHSDYFKQSHVSLVNAKILRSFESLTVADIITFCEKLESNMGVYTGSITATECQPGCLLITCVFPIHYALHAYETAKANFLRFRQFHIQFIEIESFPKVYVLNFSINLGESMSGKLVRMYLILLYTASYVFICTFYNTHVCSYNINFHLY